jgi:hypothetical protein
LLDLQTGRKVVPPEFLNPNAMNNAHSLLQDGRFARWCRDRGIDLFGYLETAEVEVEAARAPVAKKAARASQSRSGLVGLDMMEVRILPQSFDEMTVEEAREILGRMPEKMPSTAWMMLRTHLTERPDSFAFKTGEGSVGLLQVEADKKQPGKLTIRYRRERSD